MISLHQGIDIVNISKFRDVAERHPELINEIFTEQEQKYCNSKKDPAVHFAGRFAVKESFVKAIGTGFFINGIDNMFREIEVYASASGKPMIKLSGWAKKLAAKKKMSEMSVSISHASEYAVASVISVES
jgi:holo-[acyl-carrier protein] synthase